MKNFIISLSKIESSMNTAMALKTQLLNYSETVEMFEGTYGTDAVKMMEEENRILHHLGIKGEINPNDDATLKMMTPGVKGCFYSHYRLWQKCVELNEPIIIWEDDIVLRRKFIPIEWKDVLVVALGHQQKSPKYMHLLESPEDPPRPETYKQSSMPGCCGYAIKPHAAKKLLEIYEKTYLPADNAINVHHLTIEIHSHVMGIALVKKDGKKSLTRTKFWNDWVK
jgi:GR25 family glycosyltransferase involved in LPS biosynthesis